MSARAIAPFRVSALFPNLTGPFPPGGLRRDLWGALNGTLVSLPQTMAYGLILGTVLGDEWSGAGVVAALYGSVLSILVSALLGGSPFTVAGPRAGAALVFAALVAGLRAHPAVAGLPHADLVALALGGVAVLGAGLMQLGLGLARLGRLSQFVPQPVIAGFLNASALLTLASQLHTATGIPDHLGVLTHLGQIQPATLGLTLATTALILGAKRLGGPVPPMLSGLVAGSLLFHLLALAGWGEALGGTLAAIPDAVPLRLAVADARALDGGAFFELLPMLLAASASICTLGTLDTLLSASVIDTLTLRHTDGNRELAAQGIGNILIGLLGLLPGSGSLGRTMALVRVGAASVRAPLLVGLFTLACTLLLAPLIHRLPQAVMAGLLIVVGIEQFDRWTPTLFRRMAEGRPAARAVLGELLAVAVVVVTSLAVNMVAAVGMGVLVSLLAFVAQMARSPVRRAYLANALVSRVQGDEGRRRFIELHGHRIAIIEMEGALFFGSVAELEAEVDALSGRGCSHVILDLRRVKDVDSTGASALVRIHARLAKAGGMLVVAHVERERRAAANGSWPEERRRDYAERRIWRKLDWLGVAAELGEDRLVADVDAALVLCEAHLSPALGHAALPVAAAVRQAEILRGLDRAQLRRLRRFTRRRDHGAGDTIFRQGDSPDSVYFLARGRVDVVIDLARTERKLRLQSLSPGAVFGEMALIAPAPRSANLVALEPSRCYRLSVEDFQRLKAEDSELALALIGNMAKIFAERLRATNTLLAALES